MLHKVAVATTSLLAGAVLLAAPAAARALHDDGTVPRAALPSEPAAAAPARTCGPEPTSGRAWERLFDGLSGTWAGGDGAASIRLPDGRLLWLFGDTFTGTVNADRSRGADAAIVRNSIVVTDGTCVDVVTTATDALPGREGTWLWPTTGAVVASARGGSTELVVLAQRVRRTGEGAYDFIRVGTASVRVTVPWRGVPAVGAVRDLPSDDVLWGAGLVAEGARTWVYGTREVHEDLVFGRDLLLARAPTTTLDDPSTWTYRTASGWSSDRADAAVVRPARDGVSTVPSAARVGSAYVIVTKAQEFVDDDVIALSAPNPWGPWHERVLFRSASKGDVVRYSPALVAGARPGHATVVVSRTSTSAEELLRDAELARPTFTDVRAL